MSDNRITGGPKGPSTTITGTPSPSDRPKSSKTFTVKQHDEPKTASQTDDTKEAGAALFSDPAPSGAVTTDLGNPTGTSRLDKAKIAGQITGVVPAGLQGTPRTTATSPALNTPNLEPTSLQKSTKAELEKNGIPVPAALNGEPRTVARTPSEAPQP